MLRELYAEAERLRVAQGYAGQDCARCPGRQACVDVWDRLCHRWGKGVVERAVREVLLGLSFPCGLRAQPLDLRPRYVGRFRSQREVVDVQAE